MARKLDNGRVQCEQCGNNYKCPGKHWYQSKECSYPDITQLKKDILTGCLMGDGVIENKGSGNQHLRVLWASEEQCLWLHRQFGWLSNGSRLIRTAEENASLCRESGFRSDAKEENYKDIFDVRTRCHPFITTLTDWYGESEHGDKRWPENINLSPTVLLLWYIGDGHYFDKRTQRRIEISLSNERDNEEKVRKYFMRADVEPHSTWNTSERTDGSLKCQATWTVYGSKTLFEHMKKSPLMEDGPPDGFEYKFPDEYGGTGKSMVDVEV